MLKAELKSRKSSLTYELLVSRCVKAWWITAETASAVDVVFLICDITTLLNVCVMIGVRATGLESLRQVTRWAFGTRMMVDVLRATAGIIVDHSLNNNVLDYCSIQDAGKLNWIHSHMNLISYSRVDMFLGSSLGLTLMPD